MSKIAVIGGSCFASLKNLVITHSTAVKTPFGEPSSLLSYGILGDHEVVYLPRRGDAKPMPPHQINFRANIWALRDAGVKTVIATAAVAGLTKAYEAGAVVIPDQLIDYTYGRDNTFLGEDSRVTHIPFSYPYCEPLRQKMIQNAEQLHIKVQTKGTYAVTQGPRYETQAEIKRLVQDGCHFVGMTGMPEAALAKELDLDYACIALVVRNVASDEPSHDKRHIEEGEIVLERLVESVILNLEEVDSLNLQSVAGQS